MFGQVDWTPIKTHPTVEGCEAQRMEVQLKLGASISYRCFPGHVDPRESKGK